jgi:hypothetical protein
MGRLEGVEGWEGGYASANAPSDSPCEWRRQSSGCGVRHLVWVMGGLLQLVSVGIQIGLPPLLARVDSEQLLGAAFLAALALFQVPAGWLVDQIGPVPVIVGELVLSAIVLATMPDYPIGLPQVLILGVAQAGVAPAMALLLTTWARSPRERDCALICKAVGSAGAWLGVWQLLSTSSLLSTALRSLAASAGISGVVWLLAGASGPTQWARAPLSRLLPLTVSDLHALPPLNVNEKAAKEKREREHRQKAQLAKQQAGKANAKYARKMDKRSGDAYNEYKAKADAKKAAAVAAKAEKAAAAGKATGDRNAGPTTQHRSACLALLSRTHLADAISTLPCVCVRSQLLTCIRRKEHSATAGPLGWSCSVAEMWWRSRNPRFVSVGLQCYNISCATAAATTGAAAESYTGAIATILAVADGGGWTGRGSDVCLDEV